MAKPYLILSCDGGGIRGLLSALLIKKLDEQCQLLRRVDLFAGTSAGGLIALGLAAGMPIRSICELFRKNAKRIFQPPASPDFKIPEWLALIFKQLNPDLVKLLEQNYKYLYYVRYDNRGLLNTLGDVETEAIRNDLLLSDIPRKVLVTTFALESKSGWKPVALHNLGRSEVTSHIIEAAMCTCATPVYFPPYEHRQLGYCIDGGIFANNPGSLAAATAIHHGTELSSLRLLSIGTGSPVHAFPIPHVLFFTALETYGPIAWLLPVKMDERTPTYPLLNALLDGSAEHDTLVCHSLLKDSYLRVQVALTNEMPMDGVEDENLDQLAKLADDFASSKDWKPIREWVLRQTTV
ncbi:MAG TPA: patatin-like phospholipase family protein [Gemmataceae bacterium]|nr:patatin-like phospholipase family protein [Gemmataceae bacterium]